MRGRVSQVASKTTSKPKEGVGLESVHGVGDGRDRNASWDALEENIDTISMVL
jgi:hypothetical protein